MASSRTETGLGVSLFRPSGVRMGLNVAVENARYVFRDALADRIMSEFEEVDTLGVSANAAARWNDRWSWFGLLDAEAVRAKGGEWDDAVAGGGLFFLSRKISDRLTLSPGILVRHRIGEGLLAVPILGLDWKITDRIEARLAERALLQYRLDEKGRWKAAVEAAYVSRAARHRTDEDSRADFRERQVPVLGSLTWQPNPGMRFQAFAGSAVWHEIKLSRNSQTEHVELDPALIAGLSGLVRF